MNMLLSVDKKIIKNKTNKFPKITASYIKNNKQNKFYVKYFLQYFHKKKFEL